MCGLSSSVAYSVIGCCFMLFIALKTPREPQNPVTPTSRGSPTWSHSAVGHHKSANVVGFWWEHQTEADPTAVQHWVGSGLQAGLLNHDLYVHKSGSLELPLVAEFDLVNKQCCYSVVLVEYTTLRQYNRNITAYELWKGALQFTLDFLCTYSIFLI